VQRGRSIAFENRLRMAEAVVLHGLSIGAVALAYGVSSKSVGRLVRRFRALGAAGLEELSRKPRTSPARKGLDVELQILELRQLGCGAARIGAAVEASGSTVHRILLAHGLSSLTPPPPKYIRYEMTHPGELVHLDSKVMSALSPGCKPSHLFAAIDAYSREVFIQVHRRADGKASLCFLEYLLGCVPL
jgi:transposase